MDGEQKVGSATVTGAQIPLPIYLFLCYWCWADEGIS